MKKAIALMIFSALSLPALKSQEADRAYHEFKTLFGDRNVTHGGYGALTINYSRIDSKDALQVGARGAWVIGHSVALGMGGSAFVNDYSWNPGLLGGRNVNLTGGYGGLLIEPIIFPKFPVHISIPVLIGAGGIAYTSTYNPYPYDSQSFDLIVEDASGYLLAEPGIELELNVVRFFRLALGGYYRFASDIQLYDTPPDVLNGWSFGICLKFGKF